MKANTTEQERAQALAEKHGATSYRNRADTQNPAYGFTPIQLAALIAEIEQAARRAPAVPAPQGLREAAQAVVDRWDTPLWKDVPATAVYIADLRAALAAAPQPPEAAQLDDTNVADMAQAVDSKEAAPVQMPEPAAVVVAIDRKVFADGVLRVSSASISFCDLEKVDLGSNLYTEQQVMDLLKCGGISVKTSK